jgi:SAM-dependent methyltransferase
VDLDQLQQNWDRFGQIDPLWAILSSPDKINSNWNRAEFFQTGVDEINRVMQYVDSLGISVSMKRAVDFGCGVGRLTQALCRYFDECRGIDIAPSMIDLARKYNQFGDRCVYHFNQTDALPDFETSGWDFVFSKLVLQHMVPRYSENYIREFVRILRPGGVAIFQIPAELHVAPGGITALPDIAFRALIKPQISSLVAEASSRINIVAGVRNLSSVTWPSFRQIPNCPIGLGNHWLNENGDMIRLDDSRAMLERDLNPNDETELTLTVEAPAEPGNYILELDMVQELVAWFANKGSDIARVNAVVLENQGPSSLPSEGSDPQPKMEMYGIPKLQVLDIVASAGGHVLDVQPESIAGQEWNSYTYCITKAN